VLRFKKESFTKEILKVFSFPVFEIEILIFGIVWYLEFGIYL